MTRNSWLVLCLAYIIGLLSTNLVLSANNSFTGQQWLLLLGGWSGLSLICAIAWGKSLRLANWVWLGAVIVAIWASGYFQLRLPQPATGDISQQVTRLAKEVVQVTGKVISEPRLNTNHRLKFNLQVSQLGDRQPVTGKLYASLPLLQGTGINPGEIITLEGSLYLPQGNNNPGGFNFQQYLARQGIFAAIHGFRVTSDLGSEPTWGWWKLRRRIVRSHLRGLGSPVGQLVSSMVLGRKAVDLPSDLRDRFIEAGLAHVLAASGFHVSLLLGLILKLTISLTPQPRLAVGLGTLVFYLGLTGLQPSVLRACLMGSAVLLAMTKETKVKPLGLLLLVATLILLLNPLLIGDLGFQLSFLATFGLIVTLPGLQNKLDWLPPAIATLVAVPLAASIWVLPWLGYVFHQVATYSLLTNIVCTPLIMVISLGGMISGIVALIFPLAGSGIAWLLLYPTLLLIKLVNLVTNLPQSAWAIGQIPPVIVLSIYALLLLTWLHQWWSKRWWLVLLLIATGIITPSIYRGQGGQISFLAARQSQIVFVRDRREVILINSGSHNQAKYTVIPFLARQGINHIDYGLALDSNSNSSEEWLDIDRRATVKNFASAVVNVPQLFPQTTSSIPKEISTNSINLNWNQDLAVVKLQIQNSTWLILGQSGVNNSPVLAEQIAQYIQQENLPSQHPIIVWSGNRIPTTWFKLLHPKIAIASDTKIDSAALTQLSDQPIQLHNTAQDGMIAWNLQGQLIFQANNWD